MSLSSISSSQLSGVIYQNREALDFQRSLAEWVSEAHFDEKAGREEAAIRMRVAFDNRHEKLDLGNLGLTCLPSAIGALSLTHLVLLGNKIQSLPLEMRNLTQLKDLRLGNNQLKHWPEVLEHLVLLTHLSLFGNQLEDVSPHIGKLTFLTLLELQGNKIESLPPEIGRCTEITELNLANNPLQALPSEMSNFHRLVKLDFRHTQVKKLSGALEEFLIKRCFINTYAREGASQWNVNGGIKLSPRCYHCIFLYGRWREFLCNYAVAFPKANLVKGEALFKCVAKLHANSVEQLQRFFNRLPNIADYRRPETRYNALMRIHRIIEGLTQSKAFVETVLTILASHEERCGDQVATAFAQIEQQYPLYCVQEDICSFVNRLVGMERERLVEQWARKFAREMGSQGEELEFVLVFKLRLKKYLSLPLETQGMLYRNYVETIVGRQRLLDEMALCGAKILQNTAGDENQEAILLKSSLWIDRMKKECSAEIEALQNSLNEYWLECDPAVLKSLGVDIVGKTPHELNQAAEELLLQKTNQLIEERTHFVLELERSLIDWVNEVPEEGYRKRAAKAIKEAIRLKSETLSLYGLRLSSLPKIIGTMTYLKELNVAANKLQEVPEFLGNLLGLQKLVVYANHIHSLPLSLGSLTALTHFDLSRNKVQVLPDFIGNFAALKELNLGENKLESLPETLGNLRELERLYLYSNQIKVLPGSIGQLSKLKQLSIWSNGLSTLPSTIGKLTQLIILQLNANRLQVLPDELGNLVQLEKLELRFNPITMLPESFSGGLDIRSVETANEVKFPSDWERQCRELASSLIQLISEIPGYPSIERDRVENLSWLSGDSWWFSVQWLASLHQDIPLDKSALKKLDSIFSQGVASFTNRFIRLQNMLRVHRLLQGMAQNRQFLSAILELIAKRNDISSDVEVALSLFEGLYKLHIEASQKDMADYANILLSAYRESLAEKDALRFSGNHNRYHIAFNFHLKMQFPLLTDFSESLYKGYMEHAHEAEVKKLPAAIAKSAERILAATSTVNQKLAILMDNPLWLKKMEREYAREIEEYSQHQIDQLIRAKTLEMLEQQQPTTSQPLEPLEEKEREGKHDE